MFNPPKGKQGTKGSKQIVTDNVATLKFYLYMAMGSSLFYFLCLFIFKEMTGTVITMSIFSIICLGGGYHFMAFMSKSKVTENGTILDAGTDLNMEGGLAEHVKDLIILTSFTQLLSLISSYFWFLMLLVPIRAGWMLWGSVIKPWLSQKNEEPEVNEKKQKKLDRKMRRVR